MMEKEHHKQEAEFFDGHVHTYLPRKTHRKETFYSTKYKLDDQPFKHCTEEIYERTFFLLTSTPVTSHKASVISTSLAQPHTTITQQSIFSTTIVRSTDNLNTALVRSMDNPCAQVVSGNEPVSLLARSSISCPKLTYSVPHHSFLTTDGTTSTKVHISKDSLCSSPASSTASGNFSEETSDGQHVSQQQIHNNTESQYSSSVALRNGNNVDENTSQTQQKKSYSTQGTQTDHSISCPCSCVYSKRLQTGNSSKICDGEDKKNILTISSSSQDTDRRDSGFSSPGSSSNRISLSPKPFATNLTSMREETSPGPSNAKNHEKHDENNNFDSVDVIVNSGSHVLKHRYDETKERYLQSIKQTIIDPQKELYLIELKKRLLKNRLQTMDHKDNEENLQEWEPIIPIKKPRKSALKKNTVSEPKSDTKVIVNAVDCRRHTRLCTKDLINVILQVRQCLDIVKRCSTAPGRQLTLKHNVRVHQKIQLQSYAMPQTSNKRNSLVTIEKLRECRQYYCDGKTEKLDEATNCFPCIKKSRKEKERVPLLQNHSTDNSQVSKMLPDLHRSAVTGDVRSMLELLQSQSLDINVRDTKGHPPIHHALKNKHYRTAILLLEAGANIKEYTQEKVREFKKIQEIMEKNKIDKS